MGQKNAEAGQGTCSLGEECRFQYRSLPQVGIPVVTHVRGWNLGDLTSRNYLSCNIENRRERGYDSHSGIEPLRPLFVGTLSLVVGLDLGSKYGENGTGRIAGLKLGGEWM
jgi:hypothetical protein